MLKFKNLTELRESFLKKSTDFLLENHPSITLDDKEYIKKSIITPDFHDLLYLNQKIISVYSLKENTDDVLALAWAINKENLHILPIDVQFIHLNIIKEAPNQAVLGGTAQVEFISLPNSKPLTAKVDTGAELSSLHVDMAQQQHGDTIRFSSKELSDKTFTMHVREWETVKSANGETKRPVVMMNIRVNGKPVSNVLFNLADRSKMEYPVLLGKNALEQGNFLVNPTKENIDIKTSEQQLQEHFKNILSPITSITESNNLEKLFEQLYNSNISFSDLIKYMEMRVSKKD